MIMKKKHEEELNKMIKKFNEMRKQGDIEHNEKLEKRRQDWEEQENQSWINTTIERRLEMPTYAMEKAISQHLSKNKLKPVLRGVGSGPVNTSEHGPHDEPGGQHHTCADRGSNLTGRIQEAGPGDISKVAGR